VADTVIDVEGLRKNFGSVEALRGLDLTVDRGTVLGMLGPNGAGKTTAVRILTTLLQPDSGRAIVDGHDVVHEPSAVRRLIGLTGQATAIVDELTGRENLVMVGRLHHFAKSVAADRAAALLDEFDLRDAADRPAKTYSGGMRRRLDLAASLVSNPRVLFLDEPTTGLDPRSRLGMWDVIRRLVAGGTTLLLTTQYLDEADELADRIVVIDRGLAIATGTSAELKAKVGGDVVEFTLPDAGQRDRALAAVASVGEAPPTFDDRRECVSVRVGARGSDGLIETVRALDTAQVDVAGLALRQPSLDDVFLSLTGHGAEDELEPAAQPTSGRRPRRGGPR
jgi:ABC-2 type transport system ATP-binding protein